MNLGDGPMALLGGKRRVAEKAIKTGETIGQFKLVDVNTSEITFAWTFNGEWHGVPVLREMADNTVPAALMPDTRSSPAASAPPPPPPVVKNPGRAN